MANSDGSGGVRLAAGAPLEFSPDGKSVVGTFAQGMEIVPVGAGTVQHFSHHADDVEELIGFLPDAKRILLWVQDPKGNIRLDILTPSTSKRETISHKELFPLIGKSHVISPDGQRVIMRTADFQYVLLSLKDQSVQLLKNLEAGEEPLEWTKDGHAIYVYSTRRIPCKIYKLEITTGNRQEFKEIIPPDPVGISEISTFRVSSDERIYAYTYQRILSALFQIRGLQ